MPRTSDTGNVRKICGCGRAKWSTCAHAWYVDFKAPIGHRRRPGERLRKNLDLFAGKHAASLFEAKGEGRRAIEAWLEGRDPKELQPADRPTLTQLLDDYARRPNASPNDKPQVNAITSAIVMGQAFGTWRAADITREALEAFQAARPRVAGNRNLALLKSMFGWAVRGGLLPATPFRVGNVAVVKLASEESRTRRLQPGEEEKLLMAARGLQPLIVAALETGCRRGELLSLQWHQVRFTPRAELFLPAQKTKAKKDRRVPISTALRVILEARRHDPAGDLVPADGYVFGDEVGRRRRSMKTAWRLTCRRAGLDDLHFHDLRREAGSRWMDAGVPLATIQRWLGHHNISQTSKYLAASLGGDADEMRAFEERIGRVKTPLTQIDLSPGSTEQPEARTDEPRHEQTSKDAVVH